MDGGEDLISTLPDCLLGEIVTRLPTADAVRVQVLSTRWRHIWRSSLLNLDLHGTKKRDYKHRVYSILAAHTGPGRRLKLEWPYDQGELYNSCLCSPVLNGLQELEIEPGHRSNKWNKTTALPERGLFHFTPMLRQLRIGYHTFPSAATVASSLRLAHLELVSFCCVDISEGTLHGVLVGFPALKTLLLNKCTGFATVRINSATMTTFAISPADSATTNNTYYNSEDANQTVRVMTSQVVIKDAPLLEQPAVPTRT